MRHAGLFLIMALTSALCWPNEPQKTLKISTQIANSEYRSELSKAFRRFEKQHPGIKVEIMGFRGDNYSKEVERWLAEGKGPDIMYWYGGMRLAHYARQGLLQNIDAFWKEQDYDLAFPEWSKNSVMVDGRVYGVPDGIVLWALYYRPSVFETFGVTLPTTWQGALNACVSLRMQDIDLFAFGSASAWMTHAWFDYISLRLHGLTFHQRLLNGEISFTDPRVLETLSYWRELVNAGCFTNNHENYDFYKLIPRLYHGLSAMHLTFGLIESDLPKSVDGDIDVMPFPSIRKGIDSYTVAPVDIFVVPAYAKMDKDLKALLSFITSSEIQTIAYSDAPRAPARLDKAVHTSTVMNKAFDILKKSPGSINFFDRDTAIELASETPDIFLRFLEHRDVRRCAEELEALRQRVLKLGVYPSLGTSDQLKP